MRNPHDRTHSYSQYVQKGIATVPSDEVRKSFSKGIYTTNVFSFRLKKKHHAGSYFIDLKDQYGTIKSDYIRRNEITISKTDIKCIASIGLKEEVGT